MNTKNQIFIKATVALELAEFWAKENNALMEKIWRDEYNALMLKWIK